MASKDDDMIADYINQANGTTVLVRNNLEDKKAENFTAHGIEGIKLVDSVHQSKNKDRFTEIDSYTMYYEGLPTERPPEDEYHISKDKLFQDEAKDFNSSAKKFRSDKEFYHFVEMNGHRLGFGGKMYGHKADALIVFKKNNEGHITIPVIFNMPAIQINRDTLWAKGIIKLNYNLKNGWDSPMHTRHDTHHSSFFKVDLHRLPSQFLIPHEKFGLKAPWTMWNEMAA